MLNIFVDLDGVVFDFDTHFERCFGFPCAGGIPDEILWDKIDNHKGEFFYELPLMKGAEDALRELESLDLPIYFLTKTPKHDFERCALQKIRAVREKYTTDHLVIPVTHTKANYIQRQGDILIDDFAKNITPWILAGGHGILFKDWNQTLENLTDYLEKYYDAEDERFRKYVA